MALRLSQGLQAKLAGAVTTRVDDASKISFVAATKRIEDLNNNLLAGGFRPGDIVNVTNTANNNGTHIIALVAENGSYMTTVGSLTDEAAGCNPTITADGKSMKEIFHASVMRLYSGSPPADANDAETGTLLIELTLDALPFTPGSPLNGLMFGDIVDGKLTKASGASWQGEHLVAGAIGHFRLYDNAREIGQSTTAIRCQGTVATSGGDLTVGKTAAIDAGGFTTVTNLSLHVPRA